MTKGDAIVIVNVYDDILGQACVDMSRIWYITAERASAMYGREWGEDEVCDALFIMGRTESRFVISKPCRVRKRI